MNPMISFVVPVYNVELYLEECLNSIVTQDYANKELILVDDGSTDGSSDICEKFAEKYDYIKIIRQKNSGLSAARNQGLLASNGEYVLFVDSDDYIEVGAVSKIMNNIDRAAEVVFLEAQKIRDGSVTPLGDGIKKDKVSGKSREEVLNFLANCPKLPASQCTKLMKRDIFLKNKEMMFEPGLLSEDIDETLKLLLSAKRFDYCDIMYYNYRQGRANSITNTVSEKHFGDLLYILKKWSDRCGGMLDCEKNFVLNSLAYEYAIMFLFYSRLPKECRKNYKSEFKHFDYLLNVRKERKYKILNKLYRITSIDVTAYVVKVFYKVKQILEYKKQV